MSTAKTIRNARTKTWLPTLLPILVHALSIFLTLKLIGCYMPAKPRGFFCDDATIRYPLRPETISAKLLFFIGFFVPLAIIKICDVILNKLLLLNRRRFRRASDGKESSDQGDASSQSKDLYQSDRSTPDDERDGLIVTNRRNLSYDSAPLLETKKGLDRHPSVDNENRACQIESRVPLIKHEGHSETSFYCFGVSTTLFFTGIGKIGAGRLRPHFIERCKPNINCTDPNFKFTYIENYSCTAPNLTHYTLSYINTSWPSGHASIIFYSMLYISIYLYLTVPSIVQLKKSTSTFNPILLYSLFVFMISLATYISLTRISDYHHHPTDVLSGSLLGVVVAIVMSFLSMRERDRVRLED